MRKTALMAAVFCVLMIGGAAGPIPAHAQPVGQGQAIVTTALKYLGAPYSSTTANPSRGFSPIGFVRYVYRANGIRLHINIRHPSYPRLLADGPEVSMADLQPGDLLFFKDTTWPGISHVGIYLGNGKFVHAEYYGTGVTVTSLTKDPKDGSYWDAHWQTANRPWASE